MEIKILTPEVYGVYSDEILAMLYASNQDFVPPLSARSSTTQADLSAAISGKDGVLLYFNEMKKQRILVATEYDKLLGFVSYKENYTNTHIAEDFRPNIYISTLIVKPDARGRHLTQGMYESLFEAYASSYVFTRTWSTNAAHIRILSKFDFKTFYTLKNDRGPGIDTVYFIKEPTR